jgi:hypothetical protein
MEKGPSFVGEKVKEKAPSSAAPTSSPLKKKKKKKKSPSSSASSSPKPYAERPAAPAPPAMVADSSQEASPSKYGQRKNVIEP